jgi:hypothetical protein
MKEATGQTSRTDAIVPVMVKQAKYKECTREQGASWPTVSFLGSRQFGIWPSFEYHFYFKYRYRIRTY